LRRIVYLVVCRDVIGRRIMPRNVEQQLDLRRHLGNDN